MCRWVHIYTCTTWIQNNNQLIHNTFTVTTNNTAWNQKKKKKKKTSDFGNCKNRYIGHFFCLLFAMIQCWLFVFFLFIFICSKYVVQEHGFWILLFIQTKAIIEFTASQQKEWANLVYWWGRRKRRLRQNHITMHELIVSFNSQQVLNMYTDTLTMKAKCDLNKKKIITKHLQWESA